MLFIGQSPETKKKSASSSWLRCKEHYLISKRMNPRPKSFPKCIKCQLTSGKKWTENQILKSPKVSKEIVQNRIVYLAQQKRQSTNLSKGMNQFIGIFRGLYWPKEAKMN